MNKRFAIFDMDGTLVDSMAFWQRLGREFLASQNITERVDEVLERIIPMTMIESAALFIQEFGLSRTQEDLAAEMNAIMERHYRSDIPLKPGVPEYLNMLRSNGVKMCVASATPVHLIRACLTRLGVAEYFSFLISCDEAGAGKDRPGVYLLASEKLEAAPQETAVYEEGFLIQLKAGMVYELRAVWEEDKLSDRGFSGEAGYIFMTDGTSDTDAE